LPGLVSPLPADLYLWPAPHTYTGQDMAELHALGSPPLVELLITHLLEAGARAARPGEFTLRAFLAGKLDLPRAEAVHAVIEANDRSELQQALAQLAGGVTRPLEGLREELLNLLADLEAGLDFADEDIHFLEPEALLRQLAKAMAQMTLVSKQLTERSISARPFRVVLAGRPNAGKSSLFNALTGAAGALVSDQPGTTRDYLVARLKVDGPPIELVDTAGWRPADDTIEAQAQHLGREQTQHADLILLCVEACSTLDAEEHAWAQRPDVLTVMTKNDLARADEGLATSTRTGSGIDALRQAIIERAASRKETALAPGLSRCRHHVTRCLDHLRRGHEMVLFDEPVDLLAVELRGALDELGEMVGAVYTDDLLDRIFSRFCIGK
jgi:tRNA modification GTPase